MFEVGDLSRRYRFMAIGAPIFLSLCSATLGASVSLDQKNYACAGDTMVVTVVDSPPPSSATVQVLNDSNVVIDTETVSGFSDPNGGVFVSSPIPVVESGSPAPNNGLVETRFAWTVIATYMTETAKAVACKPTQVSGTAGGTLNGITINATMTGQIDYDNGIGIVNISGLPDDAIGESLRAFTGLGTFAGTMASLTDPRAQSPLELTAGNFTRVMSVFDSRTGKTITYNHVVSYPHTGNVITSTLTLGGQIDIINPVHRIEHLNWQQDFLPQGASIGLRQSQVMMFVPGPTGPLPTVSTFTHGGMGTVTPTVVSTTRIPTALDRAQIRDVDRISVEYDPGLNTLTIVSRNGMRLAPPPGIPTLSTWGIVALVLLLMTAALILQHRNQSREPNPRP